MKRARRNQRDKQLTPAQVLALVIGLDERHPEFASTDAARAAYFAHREQVNAAGNGSSWAQIEFELGGFKPIDCGSINRALARLGLPLYPKVSWPPVRETAIVENFERRSIQ
jgi:hypothetical protein